MMKTRILIATLSVLVVAAVALAEAIPVLNAQGKRVDPGKPQYLVQILATTGTGNDRKALYNPNLTVIDGQEATFQTGGEFPVPGEAQGISDGLTVRARVQALADGKLRVWLSFADGKATKPDESQIIVHESVVRSVHTIKPEQPIALQFDKTTTIRVAIHPLERK